MAPWYHNRFLSYYGNGGDKFRNIELDDAVLNDNPNMTDKGSAKSTYVEFNDYAICIDTGTILDAMSWGYWHYSSGQMPDAGPQMLLNNNASLQQAMNTWNSQFPNNQFHFHE